MLQDTRSAGWIVSSETDVGPGRGSASKQEAGRRFRFDWTTMGSHGTDLAFADIAEIVMPMSIHDAAFEHS